MKQLVLKIGKTRTIVFITLFSIVASVLITLLVNWFFSSTQQIPLFAMLISSIFAPLVIAPMVSSPMVKLLFHINELEIGMRHLATYDELTKLLNRRTFFQRSEYAYQVAKREKQNFAILVVDLDLFKLINDQHGHATGDQVLALFSKVVNQISRASDIVGRIGGEEFAFFLQNTNPVEAENFANRLHSAIGEVSLECKGSKISFTMSIGVAEFTGENESRLDTLMQLADEAMYQAKKLGGGQTVKVTGL